MLLFSQVAGLESIRAIWLKKKSTAEVFEISEIFLRDIFAKDFLKKLKIYRINFYSKGGLHYLKGNQSLYSNADADADTNADTNAYANADLLIFVEPQ